MKKLIVSTLQIFCLSLLLSTVVSAQVATWTGNGGNNLWSNSSNWDSGVVPSTNYDVVIPSNSGTVLFDMNNRVIQSLIIYRSELKIQSGKQLVVNNSPYNQAITITSSASISNDGRLIVQDGQNNGIDASGTLQNEGVIELYNFPGHGIESSNKVVNLGQVDLGNVGTPSSFAIQLNNGIFHNEGQVNFLEKYPSYGFFVRPNAELYNSKTGELIFENGTNGPLLVDGEVNNYGLIQMNQTSVTGEFIRLNGDMYNDGGLFINFAGSTNSTGVQLTQGGTFTNDSEVEIVGTNSSSQIGFNVISNAELDNRSDGAIKTTRVGVGVNVNEFVARFDNAGFCKFRYGIGLRNQLGTVVNTGTMRFDSGAQLLNSRSLTNEACGVMTFHGNINNQQGTFVNHGGIYASSSVMAYRTFTGNSIQNFGVAHGPYDFFQGNLAPLGIRVGTIQTVAGQINYQPALDIGNLGNYTVGNNWYRNSNLTGILASYNQSTNNLSIDFPAAEGRRYMYLLFTHSSGCTIKTYILFDAPLTEQDQDPNDQHDFTEYRTGTAQENSHSAQLSVFPNPSNGQFNLQLDQTLIGTTELRLIDLTGRTVWTQKEQDLSNLSLDFTGQLPTGIYHLQVLHGDAPITTERLMIQSN